MTMEILDAIWDGLIDCLKMLPFLFLAFLLLEVLEHRAAEKMNRLLRKTEKAGPAVGALLGCVPQCGFSVLASNFYAGGMISLGTLMAVFLATSDEALIILISGAAPADKILWMILAKILIGILFGYLIMLVMHLFRIHTDRRKIGDKCGNLCREDDCGCHDEKAGLLKPALKHTAKIFLFLLVFTIALNVLLEVVGLDKISGLLLTDSPFQPVLAALIGLIPNCASSVILTQLYVQGVLSFGAAIAGLCSSAGLGLVVLFRMNKSRSENVIILGLLFGISVLSGVILQAVL